LMNTNLKARFKTTMIFHGLSVVNWVESSTTLMGRIIVVVTQKNNAAHKAGGQVFADLDADFGPALAARTSG